MSGPNEQAAPVETGERIATFARPGRGNKAAEELRITRDEFECHAFLSLRIWFQGHGGAWLPTKRGLTIRKGELVGVIKALCAAARAMGIELPRPGGAATGAK